MLRIFIIGKDKQNVMRDISCDRIVLFLLSARHNANTITKQQIGYAEHMMFFMLLHTIQP